MLKCLHRCKTLMSIMINLVLINRHKYAAVIYIRRRVRVSHFNMNPSEQERLDRHNARCDADRARNIAENKAILRKQSVDNAVLQASHDNFLSTVERGYDPAHPTHISLWFKSEFAWLHNCNPDGDVNDMQVRAYQTVHSKPIAKILSTAM